MKPSLLSVLLPALLLPFSGSGNAAPNEVEPVDWLLQQVRAGEATNKYDLVNQSLYRLSKIAADNPQVLSAQVRLALHQGEFEKAQQIMAALKKISPDSLATREAEANMMLISEEGRQQLQQARLLATSGRLEEARAAYDAQFNGIFPNTEIALEYWRLIARLPGQEKRAMNALAALDNRAPGSVNVRMALAQMALNQNQQAEAVKQLKAVATDPAGRTRAAELWLGTIQAQPVTAQSVAQLKQYLETFTSDKPYTDGLAELQRQQARLADPAYQQRMRGLALIERGEGAPAIPALQAALRASPNDPALLGAMGQALSRANNREAAATWFQKAIAADAEGVDIGKWQSLLQSNGYWLAIEQGDKALAANNLAEAARHYEQARRLDNSDGYALIGLGDVAVKQNNLASAEVNFQRALRLDPGNTTAARRLAGLYQQQSPEKALAFINGLSPTQKRALGDTMSALRSNARSAEADTLAQAGQWTQAAEKYRLALQDAPSDIWLNYRLAGALRQAGQTQAADAQMASMARSMPGDPIQVYAHALYLSGSERTEAALTAINALPRAKWDEDLTALHSRLEMDGVIARAETLRQRGDENGAIALLNGLPASVRRDLTLADWAMERGENRDALSRYRAVSAQAPDNLDARLGEIDALVALNQRDEARTALNALPDAAVAESLNSGRRVANAWQNVGERQRAASLYAQLKPLAAKEMPSQTSALVYRDAARLAMLAHKPDDAQADYRQAMVASGIASAPPENNDDYTRLTRNNASDDWLKRGVRSDAAEAYRQQDTTITLEEDYSRDKGTPGISDFTAHTTMLEIQTPLHDGKGFFRVDNVDVSAGTFAKNSAGNIDENFGTCSNQDAVCSRDFKQRQNGTSLGIGYDSDAWSADIGTTPLGFEVTNWVGGVTWNTDVQNLGVSLTASRRPISSSLLAFAGARDPNLASGKTWGGVIATGGAIGLSYDRGEAHGVWADISAHQITGENVADNTRERLMTGYYYKLINEDNRRATIGLNAMLWHYDKDLSDYSLGQGGYYSPQSYSSLAVPLTWRQRTENWSYDLSGSISFSHSTTKSQPRYPLDFGDLTRNNPSSTSSSSNGVGYTLRALVERRLTSHWTLGMGVDIQQAKDYTPSHGLIYVRYSMAGWQGDLDMPPQPLTPYADFK